MQHNTLEVSLNSLGVGSSAPQESPQSSNLSALSAAYKEDT